MSKEIRNIAILAHVDAGKTTLTENFLYLSGKTKQIGSVDKGTSQTDFLEIEKERGISVRASNINFDWQETKFNIIDTPGHVDFSAEVERSLRIIDAAILIISATEGVQAQTEKLWKALKESNIPTIFFINKIDRLGVDTEAVLEEIKSELTNDIIVFQKVMNEGQNDADIYPLWETDNIDESIIESLANVNEQVLERYLENKSFETNELKEILRVSVKEHKIFPVLFGSAKNALGAEILLDACNDFLPLPTNDSNQKLSALVYKIDFNNQYGKLVYVKVNSGSISTREVIYNFTKNIEEKVTGIKRIFANNYSDINKVEAGDIAAISGLNLAEIGDVLGENSGISAKVKLQDPLLTVQVKAKADKNYHDLAEALQELTYENPLLEFERLKDEKELHIKITGWMQIEVLEKILAQRYKIEASFDNPLVIYKETPAKKADGFVRYWMPKPCWAIIKFMIEPGEAGSGVVYESKVSKNDIHQKYQNEIERTIKAALIQGIKGWEVTDLKITVVEGEDHNIHTRPGDFVVATPMGIMDGLVNTDTILLEPILSFKITASLDLLGAITADITQMRGNFESPEIIDDRFKLKGKIPLATSLDFPVRLSSRSGGKAKISTKISGYQKCDTKLGVIRPYKGISPLDTAKWILKARKALQ